MLEDKVKFVKELEPAIVNHILNIEKIDYEIYQSTKNSAWTTEFVVVYYRGGAKQVRNCSGNSCGAILEEICRMLYSSQVYANEKEFYEAIKEKSIKVN